ncbi:MAG TPA: hypothetical protein VFI16_02915 [Anaeromyxobacteraceae bacterium]|nr:hypothetical protein [Anaeromyxobacteraceae bacterium]
MKSHLTALLVTGALAAACSDRPAAESSAASRVGTCPAGAQPALQGAGADLSGTGTAVIDGRLSPGEWDRAGRLDFAMNLPASEGGGTAPATLLAMNDGASLHLAVRMAGDRLGSGMSVAFELDSDGSGTLSRGDDGIIYSAWPDGFWLFSDLFRWPCPSQPGLCSFVDGDLSAGLPPPGTMEGAGTHTGGADATIVEESHPLDTGDHVHDVSLKAGDVVGFTLFLRVLAKPSCAEYPRCYGDTHLPPFATGFLRYAVAPAAVAVGIDVKPGSDENPVNLGAGGKIPVAILGSDSFDAGAVDASTVVFAGAHVERRPDGSFMASIEDVNADGRPDMVLHFAVEDLALAADATVATLEGRGCDGQAFSGSDRVWIVPPTSPPASPATLVLFDSFGPGDSYTPGSGWTLGHDSGDSWVQAIGFVPRAAGKVAGYRIAVFRVAGGSRLDAWLRADAAGQPGPVVEQFSFAVPAGLDDLMLSADSALHPPLVAGTRYWLVLAPPDLLHELFGWYRNPSIEGVLNAQGHGPFGPWHVWAGDYAPTLRIDGTAD